MDYHKKASFVIERVFERCDVDDIRQCRRYHGDEKVTAVLLNAKYLPEPETFSILERLMYLKILRPFSLVGGTALSLRYGHRTSVDIDLFNHDKFDHEPIVKALKKEFGKGYSTESKTVRWGIFCYVNEVKVDIVYHPHLPIRDIDETNNIRIYSDENIIAMK